MKKYMLTFVFALCTIGFMAQAQNVSNQIEVGSVFKIGKAETNSYKHIKFPRSNFIIKRGGLANYKGIAGSLVVVTSIKNNQDGTSVIKIKRKDGKRFFGSHKVVAVAAEAALRTGELQGIMP